MINELDRNQCLSVINELAICQVDVVVGVMNAFSFLSSIKHKPSFLPSFKLALLSFLSYLPSIFLDIFRYGF